MELKKAICVLVQLKRIKSQLPATCISNSSDYRYKENKKSKQTKTINQRSCKSYDSYTTTLRLIQLNYEILYDFIFRSIQSESNILSD